MLGPGGAPPNSRGRPRDPAIDDAILRSALSVLTAEGYQAMTIEGVAAEAGVGRPTVYRRFASKADLVSAALARVSAGEDPDLPSSSRPALLALMRITARSLATTEAMVLVGSLLAEAGRDPSLVVACRERVFGPRIAQVRRLLSKGIAAGELVSGADDEATVDLLFGALLARSMLGEPLDEAWLERVVATAMAGIAAEARS